MGIDGQKVAECLYAEFGEKEFLTRQISPDTMARLVELLEVRASGHRGRNTQVGKAIGSLDGTTHTLGTGQKVKISVNRPENLHLPRRFRFVELASVDDEVLHRGSSVEIASTGLTYTVVLVESQYGYSVSCPALPGCHSQGKDRAEALENIREAIAGWLKHEVRAAEGRTRMMLDDYLSAGYAAKMVDLNLD